MDPATRENPSRGYKSIPEASRQEFRDPDEVCHTYFYNIIRSIHRKDTDLVDLSAMVLNSSSCDHIRNMEPVRYEIKKALSPDAPKDREKINTVLFKETFPGSESYTRLTKYWAESSGTVKTHVRQGLPFFSVIKAALLYPSEGAAANAKLLQEEALDRWRVRYGPCGIILDPIDHGDVTPSGTYLAPLDDRDLEP
jgi:hypothetical protein